MTINILCIPDPNAQLLEDLVEEYGLTKAEASQVKAEFTMTDFQDGGHWYDCELTGPAKILAKVKAAQAKMEDD